MVGARQFNADAVIQGWKPAHVIAIRGTVLGRLTRNRCRGLGYTPGLHAGISKVMPGVLFCCGTKSLRYQAKIETMGIPQKLKHEIVALLSATLFFICWLAVLMLLKWLVLAEYKVTFQGFSMVFVGALVLVKVVLVLEHVSLGAWVRAQPAWVDVILRTLMYVLGVIVVMLLEKGFEGRHEHGGFIPSLIAEFQQAETYHVWANAIVISGALLVFNILSVIRAHLGEGGLRRMLLLPLPRENKEHRS